MTTHERALEAAAIRYPTKAEQEIFRQALWRSAKVIRRSPPAMIDTAPPAAEEKK